jgi:hypothetical protein
MNIKYACQRTGIDEKQYELFLKSLFEEPIMPTEHINIFHVHKAINDLIYDRINWEIRDTVNNILYMGDFDGLKDYLYRYKHIIKTFEDCTDGSQTQVIQNILTNRNNMLQYSLR